MVIKQDAQIFTNVPLSSLEFVFKRWVKDVIDEARPIASTLHPRPEPDQKFSRSQLAEYLNCTLPTIDRYRANGVIPFYQTGRTIYFKKSEVDFALLVGKKKGARSI